MPGAGAGREREREKEGERERKKGRERERGGEKRGKGERKWAYCAGDRPFKRFDSDEERRLLQGDWVWQGLLFNGRDLRGSIGREGAVNSGGGELNTRREGAPQTGRQLSETMASGKFRQQVGLPWPMQHCFGLNWLPNNCMYLS